MVGGRVPRKLVRNNHFFFLSSPFPQTTVKISSDSDLRARLRARGGDLFSLEGWGYNFPDRIRNERVHLSPRERPRLRKTYIHLKYCILLDLDEMREHAVRCRTKEKNASPCQKRACAKTAAFISTHRVWSIPVRYRNSTDRGNSTYKRVKR